MFIRRCCSVAFIWSSFALPASGGPQPVAPSASESRSAYVLARNLIGVLQFCEESGYLGPGAVDAQERVIANMTGPADEDEGDKAETLGKSGIVFVVGHEVAIAAMAKARGTTAEAACKGIVLGISDSAVK